MIEALVRRVLGIGNAALDEVDLSGDAAAALERLVDATWRLILRSGSLLVAAEKGAARGDRTPGACGRR